MANTKTTKRALLASVFSLLLCVTMLVGSTFAWFTDTATTGVNTIQAGTLDIDIVDSNGVSLAGKSLGFVDEEGTLLSNILWEPGCRYLLQPATVVNNGNLWVKYTVVISGYIASEGDANLADVIDVYEGSEKIGTLSEIMTNGKLVAESTLAPKNQEGSSAAFGQLKLVMQETAGNLYQGKSISGITINVFATQYTQESDSTDNTYDAEANYANGVLVNNESELLQAIADGQSIVLNDNIALTAGVVIPVSYNGTLDLNGKTLSYASAETTGNAAITNNGTLTIQDSAAGGKITYSGVGDPTHGYSTNTITNLGNMTVLNGIIENTTTEGSSNAIDTSNNTRDVSLTINGGTIIADKITVRQITNNNTKQNNVTVNGGAIISNTRALQIHVAVDGAKADLDINGGSFTGVNYSVLTVRGSGSFTDFDEIIVNIDNAELNGPYWFLSGIGGTRNID